MNVIVLAGSPKGEVSVTMQYVKWLAQNHPEHRFEVVQVAQPIRRLEQDAGAVEAVGERVRAGDGVLWAFPLYVAMPHAGLKRFVELVFERGAGGAFQGKHCAILTTSIHFFDHAAAEYMRGISEDLGMQVDEVYAAGMQDLTRPGGTRQLADFFRKWTACIRRETRTGRRTAPVCHHVEPYRPAAALPAPRALTLGLVTQSGISQNLDRMVERMAGQFQRVERFDLSAMEIAGNCTGCLRCGFDNRCMYQGKDEVIETYRKLGDCDAVVFCGFVADRYLSARWKTFVDRMFFSTHTPVLPGKPLGFVIAGPLRQLDNLRNILEGVYGTMQARLAGFATDEGEDVDGELDALAHSLEFLARSGYAAPEAFPALGGRKVVRDEIFGGLSGVFPADHRYYRRNGWYDFPHKQRGARLGALLMRTGMRLPPVRKNMQDNMKTNMLLSFRRVVKPEPPVSGEKAKAAPQ